MKTIYGQLSELTKIKGDIPLSYPKAGGDPCTGQSSSAWVLEIADHAVALEGKDDQPIEPHNFEYEFRTKSGYQIEFYSDDSNAEFYYITNEFGITFIAQANGESAAWECFLDESKPIEQSEVYEAYGFDSQEAFELATLNEGQNFAHDLIEGYAYQSNSTGTGIVDVGHYTSYPALLTIAEMKRFEIIMIIKLGEK